MLVKQIAVFQHCEKGWKIQLHNNLSTSLAQVIYKMLLHFITIIN